MAIKIFTFAFALLAVLLVAQTVYCEETKLNQADILFIENVDVAPRIVSPAEALMESASRNRVCTAALCRSVCNALGFRFGRCNINLVCVCSNF